MYVNRIVLFAYKFVIFIEKKKTELNGIKASQLELEQNIRSKFKGSTSELEASIERFHIEMKLKEKCRNDVSITFPQVANVPISLCFICEHFL
jgi:hypothetical protein